MPARESRLWLLAGLCVVLIYGSVFFVRPIADALRENNLLRLALVASFMAAAAALLGLRLRSGGTPGWREIVVLAASAATLLWIFRAIRIPEERFHILEYGVLAGLLYGALALRRQRLGRGITPALVAIVATALVGWGEEGLQAMAPDRYYDLKDVRLNAVAALLAVVTLVALQWARQHSARGR